MEVCSGRLGLGFEGAGFGAVVCSSRAGRDGVGSSESEEMQIAERPGMEARSGRLGLDLDGAGFGATVGSFRAGRGGAGSSESLSESTRYRAVLPCICVYISGGRQGRRRSLRGCLAAGSTFLMWPV